MTTTENSRADALTDLSDDELALIREEAARITDDWCERQLMEPSQKESDAKFVREVLRLAASPSSQPAAAPIETCPVCHAKPGQWQCPKSTNDLYNAPPDAACRAAPAPSPADERTASFEAWCDRFPEISAVERLRDAWQAARRTTPAMAAEAVAFEITEQAAAEWASRHDVDHVLKHFSTQRNAIEDARTLHLLAAAPQPAQAGARVGLTDAARDVLDERHRQIYAEGWTPAHDDQHDECEMALAAIVYAESAVGYHPSCPDTWPWSPKWFKPTTPRRDLVKAGALILAELERLDRAALLNGADHDQ
ncbi:gp43 [Burkholderia pseudomallei]|nr:gp43 [Burkholderia pseudomallei]